MRTGGECWNCMIMRTGGLVLSRAHRERGHASAEQRNVN